MVVRVAVATASLITSILLLLLLLVAREVGPSGLHR